MRGSVARKRALKKEGPTLAINYFVPMGLRILHSLRNWRNHKTKLVGHFPFPTARALG